jgi:hypothetical protein
VVDGAGYLDVLDVPNVTGPGQNVDDFGLRREISVSGVAELNRDRGWGLRGRDIRDVGAVDLLRLCG